MAEKNPKPKKKIEQVFDVLPTAKTVIASIEPDIGTAGWLGRKLHVPSNSVSRNLMRLRALGRAHIHSWTKECKRRAQWVSGTGKDKEPPSLTPEEHEKQRLARRNESAARARVRRAAGAPKQDMNLTPVVELRRTLTTVDKARAAPRSWISHLTELQDSGASA